MLMAHIAGTSMFLVLLLCSASLTGSTSTENSVMTTWSDSSDDNQDNAVISEEVEKEMTKYQRGRKMGGFEVKKDSAATGANLSVGKNEHGVKRNLTIFKGGTAKASVLGFVLSSDYRIPRTHPSTHN